VSLMKILIADDDPAIRSMLRGIIENQGSEVVGEAGNGQEAIEASKRLRPDLILLDISMPVMGGFPAARYLEVNYPELPFMFVSQQRERSYLEAALNCGAKGFIVKSAAVTELPVALKTFEAGRVYRSELVN
jgi:DNA-binding NarL/FixJ family response regulator